MKVKKQPHAGMTGPRRDFVKLVHDLVRDGGRNHREVFSDFLELAFCTIAKATHPPGSARAADLEARYMRVAGHRDPAYVRRMPELLGMLQLGLRDACDDFLGSVAGELGALSEGLGQFFTPFHVSSLVAELSLGDIGDLIERQGFISVDEPACGAGGMLLAVAEVLARKGFDPGIHMFARGTDLSSTAYQMAYLQLAARGIPADVIHGNTLTLETFGAEITPAKLPFVLHHGERWAAWRRGERAEATAAAPAPTPPETAAKRQKRARRRKGGAQRELDFKETA